MDCGEVVADLRRLWQGHRLPYVPELIAAKREGEHHKLTGIVAVDQLAADVSRLRVALEQAASDTRLPGSGIVP